MFGIFWRKRRLVLLLLVVVIIVFILPIFFSRQKQDISGSSIGRKVVVFHAGSLAVPFKEISEEFEKAYPGVDVICEASGSRMCARKISDLGRSCDIMASADYTVIDELLIPEHAKWNIRFAGNEMVIAYLDKSAKANLINKDNWYKILAGSDVAFGRSDPNSDPCGYRAVFVSQLAQKYYQSPGLSKRLLDISAENIRPKEVDLLALLEVGEIDYVIIYRSVAVQHKLKYVELPPEINLSDTDFARRYTNASVRLTGKKPGRFITKTASPIVYGVTIPNNAQNKIGAEAFLEFLLDRQRGGRILESNGQKFIVPQTTTSFEQIPEKIRLYALPMVNNDEAI